jgi:hypothetical protein
LFQFHSFEYHNETRVTTTLWLLNETAAANNIHNQQQQQEWPHKSRAGVLPASKRDDFSRNGVVLFYNAAEPPPLLCATSQPFAW